MIKKGIILSGGLGTRMSPLTKSVNKQLLPIYDKPLIYYPLSILMLAGIRDILIIVNKGSINQFKKILFNGENLGIKIRYAEQDIPRGLPDAFKVGKNFIGDNNVALILGDNFFYGQSLSDNLKRIVKLKKGASTYVHSDDIGAPPSFALNLHQSEEYEPVGEWVFPPHKTKYEELFEANVNYVEGKDFVVTHLLRGKTNDFTVSGDYFGQVCEEGRCIPTVFPVNFEIDVGKGSVAPYKKSNTETNTDLDEPLPLSGDYIFSKEKKEIKSFNNLSINEGEDKGLFAFFLIAFIALGLSQYRSIIFNMYLYLRLEF